MLSSVQEAKQTRLLLATTTVRCDLFMYCVFDSKRRINASKLKLPSQIMNICTYISRRSIIYFLPRCTYTDTDVKSFVLLV